MEHVWATLYLAIMLLTQAMHVFSLPANWALLLLAVLWKWTHPEADMTGWFVISRPGVRVPKLAPKISRGYGESRNPFFFSWGFCPSPVHPWCPTGLFCLHSGSLPDAAPRLSTRLSILRPRQAPVERAGPPGDASYRSHLENAPVGA